jgi:hypothetical protein
MRKETEKYSYSRVPSHMEGVSYRICYMGR